MPIFEYLCQDCNASFEKLVYPTESETPCCPKCHSQNVERQLSAFAFRMASGGTMSTGAEANCGCCSSKKCGSCKH